ncbi:alpha/beta fold hydrolase [Paracoccus yeei]|uniref:alpha/beta fold hydrolase n=1 Tax=Paracoccus yeei TaxID=147645 RepID=UPI000687C607|nr:alpha/beta fold hydrolase [Paracoccus yeei]OWJ96957.1 alpha/beta hydrolase [Paracoccus yeei]
MTPAPFNTLPGDPLPMARAVWLRAEDGIRLRAAHWAAGGASGSVLLFPGRTEYVEKYNAVALDLNAAGYDVLAIDWRGQGMSDRLLADPRLGHVERFSDYQRDVVELVVAAQEIGLPRPWHLLAHSMGGAIGLAALAGGLPVASAVFSAPMWGLSLSNIMTRIAIGMVVVARTFGRHQGVAPGSGGAEPFVLKQGFLDNLLTGDGTRWGRFVAEADAWPDLAIGGVTHHWLAEALAECRRLAEIPAPPLPMLAGLGDGERIVSAQAIRDRVAAWPGARLLDLRSCRHEAMMERPAVRAAFLEAATAHFAASQAGPASDRQDFHATG